MLNVRNVKLSYTNRVILDDVSLSLLPGDRIALVGQNGAGKSSFLKLLAGDTPDQGLIEKPKNATIGYLQQTPCLDEGASVVDVVRSGMERHLKNIEEHQALCQQLSQAQSDREREKLNKRIDGLSHIIEQHGGFDIDYSIEKILTRLGISARAQTIGTLSGGEKRRVDLARILLSTPDIYLLDEPTNHLDVFAIEFLGEYFKSTSAPLLFVSHDRAFIDDCATRIIELDKGKIYGHEPPFANYIENKLVRELIEERTLHRRERLMVSELSWLRAGTPARTTKQNARIERAYELIDKVKQGMVEQRKKSMDAEIANARRLGGLILEFDHVGAAFGERTLFLDFSLKVVPYQRYGIIGKNGSGKSTLLSMIAKKLNPAFGNILFGKNTQIIEFDQQRVKLDQNATLKETLADHGDFVVINNKNVHIASYLEKYLFSGGDANRRVSTLSGGEQNRILLAKLFRNPGNCLLLDEPTNDLDMDSLAVLEEILLEYEGVVFIISHDRKFLDRVATSIIAFEPRFDGRVENCLTVYPGNYSDYVHMKELAPKTASQEALKEPHKEAKPKKAKTRRSFKEEQEYQAIENEIEKREAEKAALEHELSLVEAFKDHQVAQIKVDRLAALAREIEALYARWEELSQIGS